ncbi:MAG: hypothetical protein IJK71_03515 [Clostridia bacterium]|nr:hypothetical protein [Clostridia bacterium]
MAIGWKENQAFYEASHQETKKVSFFEAPPVRGAHLNITPNPIALKDARRAMIRMDFTPTNILSICGIALVWAINSLFMYYFSTTLIPITNNFVVDSLILSAVIGVIWVILRHRQEGYDDIAAEIESKYSVDGERKG